MCDSLLGISPSAMLCWQPAQLFDYRLVGDGEAGWIGAVWIVINRLVHTTARCRIVILVRASVLKTCVHMR